MNASTLLLLSVARLAPALPAVCWFFFPFPNDLAPSMQAMVALLSLLLQNSSTRYALL